MSAFPLSTQELKMPALQNTFKAELIKRYHNKYELRVTGDVTEPTTG